MNTSPKSAVDYFEKRLGTLTLAMFVRTFRMSDELSQVEYATKLGISRANLCDIEKGRKPVSPTRAAKMARKMGVPEMFLVQLAIQDSLRAGGLKYRVELKAS